MSARGPPFRLVLEHSFACSNAHRALGVHDGMGQRQVSGDSESDGAQVRQIGYASTRNPHWSIQVCTEHHRSPRREHLVTLTLEGAAGVEPIELTTDQAITLRDLLDKGATE